MIVARVRTTLRLHRFELIAFAIAFAVFAGGTFIAAAWVAGLTPPLACFGFDDGTGPASTAACQLAKVPFESALARAYALTTPLLAITYAVGLFLGVPLVARQAERGTTRLAWSLSPSRWRWYVTITAPIAAILLIFAFAGGAALDRFFQVSDPTVDIGASFVGYGARGAILLAARAFFIFGLGVALGAILGRSWPALIAGAIVATIVLGTGEGLYQDVVLRAEAVMTEGEMTSPGDLYITQRILLPDGRYVSWEEVGQDMYDIDGNPRYPIYSVVVPGERYAFVMAREAVLLGLGGLVALGIGGLAVSRRRPG